MLSRELIEATISFRCMDYRITPAKTKPLGGGWLRLGVDARIDSLTESALYVMALEQELESRG